MKTGRVDEWWFFDVLTNLTRQGAEAIYIILLLTRRRTECQIWHIYQGYTSPWRKKRRSASQRCIKIEKHAFYFEVVYNLKIEHSSLRKCTWKWGVPLMRKVNWACRIDETVPSFCSANETDIDICQNLFISSNSRTPVFSSFFSKFLIENCHF